MCLKSDEFEIGLSLLDKLKARDYQFVYICFFLLCSTLPHNVFKDKLIDLIERNPQKKGSPYLA